MKNRAKCKLCLSVIESFHPTDYVICECGEIAVDGGTDIYRVIARDYANFIRVDDDNNEIVVTVKNNVDESDSDVKRLDIDSKPTREDLLKMLDEMSRNIENLPAHAKSSAINHYDFGSLISLLSIILKS